MGVTIDPEGTETQILHDLVDFGGMDVVEVGNLDDSAYIGDIHAGREIVASLIRERLFILERNIVFEHIVHATDVDAWLRYREERSSRSILAPQIVERLRAELADADGEIMIAERAYAGRFVRV